jgi:hypothetical protein
LGLTLLIVVGLLVWLAVGLALALVIGGMIRRRDDQVCRRVADDERTTPAAGRGAGR